VGESAGPLVQRASNSCVMCGRVGSREPTGEGRGRVGSSMFGADPGRESSARKRRRLGNIEMRVGA
jgi:hypothetical protein